MNSLWYFLITIVLVVVASLFYLNYKVDNFKDWAKTRTGKGVLKGIALATIFVLVFAVIAFTNQARASEYFNDASVYFGLDYTGNLSPMCKDEGSDNRTTSNMGLKLNIYRSYDKRFEIGTKYTHHSCAFSPDDQDYNALGFIVEYKFWQR